MTDASKLAVSTLATGSADRPAVALLHGFAMSGAADFPAADWSAVFPDRTVVAVDLPAHGASPALRPGRWLGAIADALHPFGAVDVVAYSMGARLAWDLAAAVTPRIRRLVLGGLSPVEPFGAVDVSAAREALEGGPAPADPLTGIILSMATLPGNDAPALLDMVEGLAAHPFDPSATPPAQPVLLVAGQDDPMAGAGIDDLAAQLADARVVRVPGDHVAALRSPEFRAAAAEFLDR